jgi:hypothetical protein
VEQADEFSAVVDVTAHAMTCDAARRQRLLETVDACQRARLLLADLRAANDDLRLQGPGDDARGGGPLSA